MDNFKIGKRKTSDPDHEATSISDFTDGE